MTTPRKSKVPQIVHQPAAQLYARFVAGIKQRIRTAQIKAALAANAELVLHHWEIGRDILASQKQEGWGTKVIDRLAADLHREFPTLSGYSARNLKYMRAFAGAWPDHAIVQQLAAQLPWAHISREHVTNNEAVRKTLLQRGIRPESLPPSEDVKKVERRLASEEKKSLKNPDGLGSAASE